MKESLKAWCSFESMDRIKAEGSRAIRLAEPEYSLDP